MLKLIIFSLAAALTALAADNSLSPAEKKAGWILLFDGTTMNGWVDPSTHNPPGDAWTIEDGTLKTRSHPRFTEDLFTTRTFRDYELEWDWRISPRGNSGVKYRIQDHVWILPPVPGKHERFENQVERSYENRLTTRPDKGQDYVVGFEYQMTDTANPDAKSSDKHSTGALYDMVAPSQDATRPAGEWNHSRIVLKGEHVEHWLNGVKVVDTTLDSPDAMAGIHKRWANTPKVLQLLAKQPKKDTPISLQNHDDVAWFKNIKIRPLK